MIWENGIETCILSCKKYTKIQIRLILFFLSVNLFFSFLKRFLLLLYFTLQYCIGFVIHRHESTTSVREFPNMNSSPTSHPTPPLCAPAPSILYPASNLDWRFLSYMILYIFQCHSPKSSHPLPFPQSPKETQMYRRVFWTLWERERVG